PLRLQGHRPRRRRRRHGLLLRQLRPAGRRRRAGRPGVTPPRRPGGAFPMSLELTSPAFRDGQPIPRQYTADGGNLSPPLRWPDPPGDTRGFALVCEDPDAPRGTFTHWVLFNLPPESRELGEGVPPEATLPDGTAQGTNDFG